VLLEELPHHGRGSHGTILGAARCSPSAAERIFLPPLDNVEAMNERFVRLRPSVRRLAMIFVPAVLMTPALNGKDSFPVSDYPMYAFRRASTDRFQAVLGETSTGAIRPLPMSLVADTNDTLIAEALIAQAIRDGSAMLLCERVAARVGAEIEKVLVVEEIHDVVNRLSGRASLEERDVYADCAGPPGAPP
jgi:hypothetical protein